MFFRKCSLAIGFVVSCPVVEFSDLLRLCQQLARKVKIECTPSEWVSKGKKRLVYGSEKGLQTPKKRLFLLPKMGKGFIVQFNCQVVIMSFTEWVFDGLLAFFYSSNKVLCSAAVHFFPCHTFFFPWSPIKKCADWVPRHTRGRVCVVVKDKGWRFCTCHCSTFWFNTFTQMWKQKSRTINQHSVGYIVLFYCFKGNVCFLFSSLK